MLRLASLSNVDAPGHKQGGGGGVDCKLDASHVIIAAEQQQQEGKEFSFFDHLFSERNDVVGGWNFRLVLGFGQLIV